MPGFDLFRAVIEMEGCVISQREVYEAANLRAGRAQWAAFYAIRSLQEVEDHHQRAMPALEEARRREQSARLAFELADATRIACHLRRIFASNNDRLRRFFAYCVKYLRRKSPK